MDFQPIIKKFLNAKIQETRDISAGIDQNVFLILTDKGKFVIKQAKKDNGVLFRQRLAYEMIKDTSIPVPTLRYAAENFLIEEFIEGETLSNTKKDKKRYFRLVGSILKELHAKELPSKTASPKFLDSNKHLVPLDIKKLENLKYFSSGKMNKIKEFFLLHKPKLQKSVFLHGDLADAHIIIHDNKIAAIIDWGDFGTGLPEYDFACMFIDHHNDGFFDDLIRSYGKVDMNAVRYFAAIRLVWRFVRHFKDPTQKKKLAKIEKLLTNIIIEDNIN